LQLLAEGKKKQTAKQSETGSLPKAKKKERYLLKASTEKQQLSKAKKNELFY
jgi:hypothetical protein